MYVGRFLFFILILSFVFHIGCKNPSSKSSNQVKYDPKKETLITGRFFFYDDREFGCAKGWHTIRPMNYQISLSQNGNSIANGKTDFFGRISVVVPKVSMNQNIYLKLSLENKNFKVIDANNKTHEINVGQPPSRGSSFIDYKDQFIEKATALGHALMVYHSIDSAVLYAFLNLWPLGEQVLVNYPNAKGSMQLSKDLIAIHVNDFSDALAVAHEYGHLLHVRAWDGYNEIVKGSYCNHSAADETCAHYWDEREQENPAFIEGFAEFVSLAVVGCVGKDCGFPDVEHRNCNQYGDINEGNIAAFLSDMMDTTEDGPNCSKPSRCSPDNCLDFQGKDVFNSSWGEEGKSNFYNILSVLKKIPISARERSTGVVFSDYFDALKNELPDYEIKLNQTARNNWIEM